MAFAFISYSRKDNNFVDHLSTGLRDAGIDLWRDVDTIAPGENWIEQIGQATRRAGAFIYVASQNSIDSLWMQHEIEAALSLKIPVFPIIIDDQAPLHLPPILRAIQWIDFRRDFHAALQTLIRVLPDAVRTSRPVKVPVSRTKGYAFISYAEEDETFVQDLRVFMEAKGYAYWDYLGSDRDYHNQFFRELQSIIREASLTLSVLSPDWAESDWTAKEYLYSVAVKVPVLLLRAREMEPQLVLMGIPYVDFAENNAAGFLRLEHELQRKGLA